MTLNPNLILPSQDFLKPETVRFILECMQKGETNKLPPTPIVRQDEAGRYIAVDGHNLIAVRASRNEDVEVHIARNAHDGLPETSPENRQRNADLLAKYNSVVALQEEAEATGTHSFKDLIQKYPSLFQAERD